jgi:GNAT superfamily N-acetyltransferase
MARDPRLRPAVAEDAAACAAIFNDWVAATPWMPRVHPAEDVVQHYREHMLPTHAVTVAERAGRVVGFMALRDGWIAQLDLAAEARGQGLGAALVARAREASPDGLRLWTFVANDRARRFYAREGFVEARRTDGDNEEGLPDLLLVWTDRR